VRKRRIPKILINPNTVDKAPQNRRTIRPLRSRETPRSKDLLFPATLNKFYKPYVERNRVFIIGGGPSVKGMNLDLLKDEDTICVNASINNVINPTYFITMDYSYFDPRRNINTVSQVTEKAKYSYFIVNTGNAYIKTINGEVIDTRTNTVYRELNKFSGIVYSNHEKIPTGFSLDENKFVHGNNSGFCAIQLAILLGYKEIYLIGFDLSVTQKHQHYHTKYGNTSNIKNLIESYKESLLDAISSYKKTSAKFKSVLSTLTSSPLESLIKSSKLNNILKKTAVLNNKKPYIIVSYYTVNTPYEKEAAKLKSSLDKLKIPYDIVGVKNLGDWQANTRFKAKFMGQMLDKHIGKSIVWVDSDAIIHSYPKLFDNYNYDIAVRWQDFRWRKNECLSGTIYMANNSHMRDLCKRWEGENIAEGPNAKTFEQWNLGKSIIEMRTEGKIKDGNLPPEYTMIFDSMRAMYPDVKPIIEHFQASRKLKNKL